MLTRNRLRRPTSRRERGTRNAWNAGYRAAMVGQPQHWNPKVGWLRSCWDAGWAAGRGAAEEEEAAARWPLDRNESQT